MVLKPRAEAPLWINEENPDKSAKCLQYQPTREHDPWFEDEELLAAAICNGDYDGTICPIRDECLHWALLNNEQYGVWGGMLPHDRRNLRMAKRADPYLEWMWHPPTPKDEDLDDEELAEFDADLPELLNLLNPVP
ncbi:hypothetical protein GCM10010149_88860 [Nonomuraea roseoviolacea subsp. roseoviolacea]|uniref:WhiB family transcriptional regulator n=1 Tax=Nonomuraea roseoviolacea TaxID=103837 RepID=UPI0031D92479